MDSFFAGAAIKSGMTRISGFERSQLLLLPEAIDDYVAADNPVRFIDAFVDGLALKAAGFERVEAKATGRPGYAPADLLKLYIYGYLNRARSSRRLEAECHRNIEVPFGTIKQRMNKGAFLTRGLEKVRAEFSLTALAYSPRRALNILGMEELMAAVAA